MDDGHGPVWRKWTRRAERCYTYLPAISVKHTYDIAYKFTYRCVRCRYEYIYELNLLEILLFILIEFIVIQNLLMLKLIFVEDVWVNLNYY